MASAKSQSAAGPWTVKVLTLFPAMFPGPLAHSLAGKALEAGVWKLRTVDIRQGSSHKHASVDDTPFGGGPGMVMRPDVVDAAIDAAGTGAAGKRGTRWPLIYLTPRGRPINQARIRALAAGDGATLLCGRYEGIDERVIEAWEPDEVSMGDLVLSGGEAAAIALIDACVRLLPGVLGSDESPEDESFEGGLLEYPHYTRPREWRGKKVPEVLLSGHHEKVQAWRRAQAEKVTRVRRPDLWVQYEATRK
jgi:tRNA (guanine37-N1)-methyltransferase